MTAEFTGRVPTLWHGQGVTHPVTQRLTAGRKTLVIADAAITVPFSTSHSARTVAVNAQTLDAATVAMIAQEITRRTPDVIVAVGGGSVLDATKIAALALAGGGTFDYAIGHASRFALTVLPDAPPPVEIVAVPTTVGTSSETNSVGILKNDSGYRLVVGRALRPRHAIIDSRNLRSLTPASVKEGAMEAFLRLAGASTSSQRSARADSDAVALGRALLETGTRDSGSAAGRLRLARLSAATQRTSALRGRDPYSARHWYVANEVSFVLGVRKMVATTAVIAAVWRRICSGDTRWGDRKSLANFWTRATRELALPLDPPEGIAALIDRWEIPPPPRPTVHDISLISAVTQRAWGRRKPMLPDLSAEDFCDLLHDSRWSPQEVSRHADLRDSYRRR
jgi:NADP-dependent alcohol dehydrogenase